MTPPNRDAEVDALSASGAIVKTNPDPTTAVKEAMSLAIKNLDEKMQDKFDAIYKATDLARVELNDKMAATMETIKGMFAANKDLVDQLAKANQTALTAALLTQEKSAAKTELAMMDMLKQLQSSFVTANLATNEKIDRLTSRLDSGEARVLANDMSRVEVKHDNQSNRGLNLNAVSIMVSMGLLVLAVITTLLPHLTK